MKSLFRSVLIYFLDSIRQRPPKLITRALKFESMTESEFLNLLKTTEKGKLQRAAEKRQRRAKRLRKEYKNG